MFSLAAFFMQLEKPWQSVKLENSLDATLPPLLTVPLRAKLRHAIQRKLQDFASTFQGTPSQHKATAVVWPIIVPLQKFARDSIVVASLDLAKTNYG